VPFANIHLIQRQYGAKTNDTNKGFALNLGGRFVTLGGSVNYSFWNSQRDEKVAGETVTPRVQMHSLSGGMQVWRFTLNAEAIGILKDVPNQAYRKGVVGTLDTYLRVWREIYFNMQYAQSNLTAQLTPGTVAQFRLGFRNFLFSGIETMLVYGVENQEAIATDDGQTASNTISQDIQWQVHAYL
jgi:hypothetical protein